ncbi:B3 domain-containing protein Os01g0234100-like isoform X2 [Salvia miltiorrhiza]|uniref:B3 domain-containing protein Os01g0234100-like isoform X2 n=1 Tax=Salvia miltiorrhiza TaxID=226208 RepID=UPI0025ABBCAB|nr:B3 domain-containing protein Os01g0234100-like isoform X2 [Salvia miltiorrhiza]XP_057787465.1 B3 domain-containing protein Os01g0234100-like isoform X2 [Salvia miltiorrhiza]
MRTTADHHSCFEFNSSSLEQAKGVQADSLAQFPSFMKQLLKSHLSGKFYLGLPKKFCDMHLPSQDDMIILVDENEQEFSAKYSVRKNRLSGGWRGFSIAHNLLEGDALVYIVRASRLTEDDGIGLQTNDFQNGKPTSTLKVEDQMEANACTGKTARPLYLNWLAMDSHQGTKKARLNSDCKLEIDQSGKGDYPFSPSVPEGVRYSEPVVFFEDIKCFEDFKIQVDGLVLDSQISKNLRVKYFKLCCSQNMSLHGHLIKGLSGKLAVVMISETISIADAIRSADLATPLHYLECWDKTLKAFEDLGMAVGFLRNRLHKLLNLSHESQVTTESKRTKRVQADEEINNLETTSLNVEAFVVSLEAEIEALNLKNEKLDFEFRRIAQVPW